LKIDTDRFGVLEAKSSDLISFKEGILGFESLQKFIVLDPGDKTFILWLQSVEDPKVAFPILEPKFLRPDFSLTLAPFERQHLELETDQEIVAYCILTIPSNIEEISANLKAPLVINKIKRLGRQIVLQETKLEIRQNIYKELRLFLAQRPSFDQPEIPMAESISSSNLNSNVNGNGKKKEELEL